MRTLVYYIAATLDGFIAREDGSFDDFPWNDEFIDALLARYPETFPAPFRQGEPSRSENRRFDAVLMGRRTYEVGVRQNLTNPYPTLAQYVFSRSWTESPDPAVTLVSETPPTFVADLKQQNGDAIWLCGGSQLATSLMEAGLVEEVIVKLNPILFGTGIPLFTRHLQTTQLELLEHDVYHSGHMLLRYGMRTRG